MIRVALCATLALGALGACGGGRDVVVPSTDVVASTPAAGAGPTSGYDYVARRPLGVVALAEARGIDPAIARAAVDHLADAVQRCIDDAQQSGGPVPGGAARVVAQVDPGGAVANATIKVDSKAGPAATGVLCLLAPARLLVFPPSDRGDRGFAVEALWGAAAQR
jgi:hypothetical protein